MNILLSSLAIEWATTFVQKLWKDMPKQIVMLFALCLSFLAVFTVKEVLVGVPFGHTLFGKVVYAFIIAGGSRFVREFLKMLSSIAEYYTD